jgi:hypothetical protein
MLDTPHDSPADSVTTRLIATKPTSFEDALAWRFAASFYPDTRFVLWGDTLRLDVTTLATRTTKTPTGASETYVVTILWRGTCAKQSKLLP